MVTNHIYAIDGNQKSIHNFLGVSIKKADSEKLKIFKDRKENCGNCLKVFPTKKCKDSFNFEHIWSLAIFAKNVKLQSQPLKTVLVLIKHNTHHPNSQIIVIWKCRRCSETY